MGSQDKKIVKPPFVHSENAPSAAPAPERTTDPWSRQQLAEFDWKSAASLRAPEKSATKAQLAWEGTDWGEAKDAVSPEARRVAEQLDSVAQKIRAGELSVEGKTPTPETAMAAALEALLRAK